MRQDHRRQTFYIAALALCGGAALALCALRLYLAPPAGFPWLEALTLAVLCVLARDLPIYIAQGKTMDISFVPVVACMLSFGPEVTVVLYALCCLATVLQDPKTRRYYWPLLHAPRKELFNIGNILFSIWLGGLAFRLTARLTGYTGGLSWQAVAAAGVFACTAIFANLVFFILYYQVGGGGAFGGLLRQNLAGILPNVVCTIPLGLLVSLVLQRRSGVLLLVLFMAPLLLARYSFKLYLDSRSLHIRTVACLSEAIEAKDPYTRGHSRRVAYYSEQIARALRLPGGTVYQIKVAALLHDVGKIGIDDAVLRKPGALTSAEYDQVKRHPEVGRRIIDSIHLPSTVTDGVLYHHHRFDGGGYPEEGPAPGELPLCPAILAVADCYDAMTSDRPYRSAMSREQAEAVLREVSGSQLDPRVVEAFLRILPELDPGRASGDADLSLLLDPAGA